VLSTVPGMSPGGLNKKIDEAVRLLGDIVSGIYDTAFRGYGDVSGAARMPAGLRSPAKAACASAKVRDNLVVILTVRPWPTAEIRRSSTDLGCNLTRGLDRFCRTGPRARTTARSAY